MRRPKSEINQGRLAFFMVIMGWLILIEQVEKAWAWLKALLGF